jgi:uncharacterized membrane protein
MRALQTQPHTADNPSAWPRCLPVVAFALAGLAIAVYLALYQFGVLATVWEPFFGNGSTWILRQSPVARLLLIPDASLGAAAYLIEVILEILGGSDRWQRRPWLVVALGVVAAGLVVAGVVLVCLQAIFGHFCTLCLASACCSFLAAAAAAGEVRAAVGRLRRP